MCANTEKHEATTSAAQGARHNSQGIRRPPPQTPTGSRPISFPTHTPQAPDGRDTGGSID